MPLVKPNMERPVVYNQSRNSIRPEPATDPVEHLRAAALSTLKVKRRKQVPEKPALSIPVRPPPSTDTFQLDYGFDENAQLETTTADMQPTTLSQDFKGSKPLVADEESQSREEGEISEEDEPPKRHTVFHLDKSSTSLKSAKSLTPDAMDQSLIPVAMETTSPYKPATLASMPIPSLLERLSEPVVHTPIFKIEEEDHFDILMDTGADTNEGSRLPFDSVDAEHVRPGLSLNQTEYDTVKDVILDLLGWGVSFDYLVQSGISKTLLYYVFSELNLRLPDNFDMSDIIPYTPETVAYSQPSSHLNRQPSNEWLTTPSPPHPMAMQGPFQDSPIDSNLHDMERQRRQELIARKAAVQASRRTKQTTKGSNAVKTNSMDDVTMGSIVPTETVEDFLKSLGPVQDFKPSQSNTPAPEPANSHTKIQVDSTYGSEKAIKRSSTKSPGESTPSEGSFTEAPPSTSEPPTSVESTMATFSLLSDDRLPPKSTSIPTPRAPPVKRGTKRPVASDFVDFESSPRKQTTASRIERANGNGQPTGITRRLHTGASFHNIGGSRRCVIDLSDSEDEIVYTQHIEEPIPERKLPLKRQNTHPAFAPFKPSDSMSPASLAQKELEIRKMRELIARREEETRLRKLALAKSQTSSAAPTPLTATTPSTPLKMEDEDIAIPLTAQLPTAEPLSNNIRDPDSATPPTEDTGISSSDEDDAPAAGVQFFGNAELPEVPPKEEQIAGESAFLCFFGLSISARSFLLIQCLSFLHPSPSITISSSTKR
ncbi:hypothetical protein BDN70DRAFT_916639 [Pholiota conissans]|uniref:Uncharacterized protein n=1 Tax=Pholiota conissans TaxID=109636 RepID=A0A9P5ZCN8_9AGAR|nr:hypothetical protein BDN70DRAFT_916639 [Pholiota conissans]